MNEVNSEVSSASWVILLAHGSGDPRWRLPLERLRQAIVEAEPGWRIDIAYLQRCRPTLEEVLRAGRAADRHAALVLPVFLSGGGHLLRDIPEAVGAAAAASGVALRMGPVVGEEPEVFGALLQACLRLARQGDR